jgi:hypothetical protein
MCCLPLAGKVLATCVIKVVVFGLIDVAFSLVGMVLIVLGGM